MAGFLFPNYEKAGPGISKDAPKKKTFLLFFETYFRNFWKFAPASFFYSLLSLPIISNGIGAVGITNVTRNTALDKHSFGLSDFWDTVKANLKQSIFAGIINVIAFALLIFDFFIFYNFKNDTITKIGFGVCAFLLLTFIIMSYYIWTFMITFNLTLKQIYVNSFKFVFINFKNNLICLLVNILYYAINFAFVYFIPQSFYFIVGIELLVYVFAYPSFKFLLIQFCTFPAIKKYAIEPYYKEHPEEDIQKRKDLGLEVEIAKNADAEDGETFSED